MNMHLGRKGVHSLTINRCHVLCVGRVGRPRATLALPFMGQLYTTTCCTARIGFFCLLSDSKSPPRKLHTLYSLPKKLQRFENLSKSLSRKLQKLYNFPQNFRGFKNSLKIFKELPENFRSFIASLKNLRGFKIIIEYLKDFKVCAENFRDYSQILKVLKSP